eukprot:1159028-Pelagomonas_calceolata.AAC.5
MSCSCPTSAALLHFGWCYQAQLQVKSHAMSLSIPFPAAQNAFLASQWAWYCEDAAASLLFTMALLKIAVPFKSPGRCETQQIKKNSHRGVGKPSYDGTFVQSALFAAHMPSVAFLPKRCEIQQRGEHSYRGIGKPSYDGTCVQSALSAAHMPSVAFLPKRCEMQQRGEHSYSGINQPSCNGTCVLNALSCSTHALCGLPYK